jgi:hypothetical protein
MVAAFLATMTVDPSVTVDPIIIHGVMTKLLMDPKSHMIVDKGFNRLVLSKEDACYAVDFDLVKKCVLKFRQTR